MAHLGDRQVGVRPPRAARPLDDRGRPLGGFIRRHAEADEAGRELREDVGSDHPKNVVLSAGKCNIKLHDWHRRVAATILPTRSGLKRHSDGFRYDHEKTTGRITMHRVSLTVACCRIRACRGARACAGAAGRKERLDGDGDGHHPGHDRAVHPGWLQGFRHGGGQGRQCRSLAARRRHQSAHHGIQPHEGLHLAHPRPDLAGIHEADLRIRPTPT